MKNSKPWIITSLEYDPELNVTYIVFGEDTKYKIPGKWTPETMIQTLNKLRAREKQIFATCDVCGKEFLPEECENITKIQYRMIFTQGAGMWESKWRIMCPECGKEFQRWIERKKEGDTDGS